MTVKEIISAIEEVLGFNLESETEEKATFKVIGDFTAVLDKPELTKLLRRLKRFNSNEDVELFNNKSYEVLIRSENRFMGTREIKQEDSVNKLSYSFDKPSTEYLVFFLFNLYQRETKNFLRSGIMGHRLRRLVSRQEEGQTELFERDILELIKEIIPRLETIRITSKNPLDLEEFEKLLYAFIFNLGYNLDYTIMPLRFMDEFVQPFRMGRIRRSRTGDIEAPKRTYSNELILHYQKGVSSESIDHQFLSFYHVLEHFYEKIYNDDILFRVKNELTKPNFSYKRSKDIKALIGLIQSRLKYKNEEFQINELEALELTLRRFIPETVDFNNALEEINPSLIEYYKTTEVSFSKGNKVNFESENEDEIYRNLAKRIYQTRNCIVHSKEAQKVKFTPFKDDKDLLVEIYLVRLIAEFVILNDSNEL
ncbi:hypothetical protein [Roseivirga seohaensis]|uniref:hypothetical protein n=1 Tax=Roseivirga seohaensis TaxID=1914963 RepID=UPI003BA8BD7E